MAGEITLIATTRSGVRPLGVRGEPLHNAAPQLRRVVRRRLGDAAAGLLADPQLHEDGKAIDWYADWPGEVKAIVGAAAATAGRGAGRRRADTGRDPSSGRHAGRRRPARRQGRGRPVAAACRPRAGAVLHLPGRRAAGDRVLGLREGSRAIAAARRHAAPPQPPVRQPVLQAPAAACRSRGRRSRRSPGCERSCSRCRCCSSCWAAPGCCANCCLPIQR